MKYLKIALTALAVVVIPGGGLVLLATWLIKNRIKAKTKKTEPTEAENNKLCVGSEGC